MAVSEINKTNISDSSDNYLEIINHLPGMIYRCLNDESWTMKFISQRAEELTGFKPEELIDNKIISYSDLIFEVDRQKVWDDVQLALQNKEKYTLKYRILTKNHEVKWVWEQGYGVWNDKDELMFLQGIIIDISLQEQYRLALELAELKYRNIFQNIVDAYYEVNPEGTILEISPSVYHLLQYTREELLGKNVKMLYKDPSQRDVLLSQLEKKKRLHNYQITLVSKSGKDVEVSAHISMINKENGGVIISGVIRDISEIKNIQENIEKKEKYYRSLFINAPSPYFSLNRELLIQEANPAFLDMIGYNFNEVINKPIIDFVPVNEISKLTFIQHELEKKGKINNIEIDFFHKNGELITLLISGNCTWEETTDSLISQFIATNFTQRKALEEELEKAKRDAEESDRLKSAFLANMSHEIRTPMNAIMGFSSLLKDDNLTPEERHSFIDIILKRGNDLLQIISDIIDISRIEAGDIKLVMDKIYINKFISEITEEYNKIKVLKDKGHLAIRNSLMLLDDLQYIESDRVRLKQIFDNLVINALKFTNEGYIEIGYQMKSGFVEFYVKDTGIGIEPDKHEIIFDRFRQANEMINDKFGGTGLGLAIVKSLVSLLGGAVKLESAPGKGSVFKFTIPFSGKSKEETSLIQRKYKIAKKPSLKGIKVMIAEDEITNYYYLESVISRLGAKVIWASDGYSAIDMVKSHADIKLILMDIKMPGIDGLNATKKIRESNQEVIIIAQTAYAMPSDKQIAIEVGCNDYIAKPIRMETLYQILLKFFGS